jgi:hypothetical protein
MKQETFDIQHSDKNLINNETRKAKPCNITERANGVGKKRG